MTRDITPHTGKSVYDDADDGDVRIGEWYWVKDSQYTGRSDDNGPVYEEFEWLGCVMELGTNYVELRAPEIDRSSRLTRVHFDHIWKELRREPDAAAYIASRIGHFQSEVNRLLGRVQEETRKLGIVPREQMIEKQAGDSNNALVAVTSQIDTTAYKRELIVAKEETLPELFKQVEKAHKHLAGWMTAPTLPTLATIGPMKDSIKDIEERIYTIELYAGLTEDAVPVREGKPAPIDEKLHVMQRRLYMDEECLLNYRAGGMEFKDIHEFDDWMAEPENADRILPFPRCAVAMKVRRNEKEREGGDDIRQMIQMIFEREADKYTYLYIRNGEQVWRIVCNFEFDEMIFPDNTIFDPSAPLMMKNFCGRFDKFMTVNEYEVRLAERKERELLHEKWCAVNPKEDHWRSPHRGYSSFTPGEWEPFTPESVYYDEGVEHLQAQMKRYNRVAVILQGLFDRSPVMAPHHPVKVWEHRSFERSVELVYDATTLTYGDKPDFEAYRSKLNASLDVDSIVTGQEEYWLSIEANRENDRRRNSYRERDRYSSYKRYRPHGNPGPGFVAKMAEWKPRSRKAVFRWEMPLQDWRRYNDAMKPKTVTVPADKLFNVSAYTPGDYKQFFLDPRTRQEYLKWAPMLLAAEDYHAGKLALGTERGGDRYGS